MRTSTSTPSSPSVVADTSPGAVITLTLNDHTPSAFSGSTEIKEDQAKRLALQKVKTTLTNSSIQTDVSAPLQIEEGKDLLPQYHFLEVTIYESLPPRIVHVAVSNHGETWLIPSEFNALARHANLAIGDSEQAMRVATLFVKLERAGKVLLLSKATDIPYAEKYWTDPRQFQGVVVPPVSRRVQGGYQLDFYLWVQSGGLLERVTCLVMDNGELTIKSTVIVAQQVGDAIIAN